MNKEILYNKIKKYGDPEKIIFHVQTQREWDECVKEFNLQFHENSKFSIYGNQSCINVNLNLFGNLIFYKIDKRKIIKWKDYKFDKIKKIYLPSCI